jgi:uncharacterized membrane protein YgaE (UPF0421/DUF939 family)
MKFMGYRTIKTAVGSAIAMIIAKYLGLSYYTAAGIIVILSIQSTKKESFKSALVKIYAFIIAFIIAMIMFYFLGFNEFAFAIYLFIFIPISFRFKLQDGIAVNSVLVTHLMMEESIRSSLILNEIGLMFIGVGIALILNLYMPSYEQTIIKYETKVEQLISDILKQLARSLREQAVSIKEEIIYSELDEVIEDLKTIAYKNINNTFFISEDDHVRYVNMRREQYLTLKRMREHFKHIFMTLSVTIIVANFTDKIADNISKHNMAESLLVELNQLRNKFKNFELPKSRDEFENRAMLYQFLNDIEQFLQIKRRYHQQLTNNSQV